jgi:hypothetical protein
VRSERGAQPLNRKSVRLPKRGHMKAFLLFASLIVATSVLGQPVDLPTTPDGFHWERAPEVKAAFLVPDSWHFTREKHEATFAYFATREDINRVGEFKVGLTVNIMPRLKDRDSVAYAKQFIGEFPTGKKLLRTWDASMGPFVGRGCLVNDGVAVMNTLMIANPKTNTLYFFMFEAPTAEWETEWKLGEQMVRLILLDDEI